VSGAKGVDISWPRLILIDIARFCQFLQSLPYPRGSPPNAYVSETGTVVLSHSNQRRQEPLGDPRIKETCVEI